MSQWSVVQGTILSGWQQLSGSLTTVDSVTALQTWLKTAAGIGAYPNPLVTVLATAAMAAFLAFVLSIVSGNASIVDKSWSLLPAYYAWVIALHTARASLWEVHPRLALIAGLTLIWGSRLTYNFWRKGGYSWSGEDYRWPVIRAYLHPALFQVFNLVFIAAYQNFLLASLLAPAYVAWDAAYSGRGELQAPLNAVDGVGVALAACFLAFEAVADEQQWRFQTAKHALLASKKRLSGPLAQGFITSGLFCYSRHPNFFAEQAFWWSLCLFATAATGRWVGWWLGGAAMLTLLFQGSTLLTEALTARKYPKYKDYQRTTSCLIPWFPSQPARAAAKARKAADIKPEVVAEEEEEVPAAAAMAAAEAALKKSARSSSRGRGRAPEPKSQAEPTTRPRSKSAGKAAAATSNAPRQRFKSADKPAKATRGAAEAKAGDAGISAPRVTRRTTRSMA